MGLTLDDKLKELDAQRVKVKADATFMAGLRYEVEKLLGYRLRDGVLKVEVRRLPESAVTNYRVWRLDQPERLMSRGFADYELANVDMPYWYVERELAKLVASEPQS